MAKKVDKRSQFDGRTVFVTRFRVRKGGEYGAIQPAHKCRVPTYAAGVKDSVLECIQTSLGGTLGVAKEDILITGIRVEGEDIYNLSDAEQADAAAGIVKSDRPEVTLTRPSAGQINEMNTESIDSVVDTFGLEERGIVSKDASLTRKRELIIEHFEKQGTTDGESSSSGTTSDNNSGDNKTGGPDPSGSGTGTGE